MSSVWFGPMTMCVRAWRQWPEAAQVEATGSAGWKSGRCQSDQSHEGSICQRRKGVAGAATAHLAMCGTEVREVARMEHFAHSPAPQRGFGDHQRCQ